MTAYPAEKLYRLCLPGQESWYDWPDAPSCRNAIGLTVGGHTFDSSECLFEGRDIACTKRDDSATCIWWGSMEQWRCTDLTQGTVDVQCPAGDSHQIVWDCGDDVCYHTRCASPTTLTQDGFIGP